jgi:hypothetical protein
MESSHSKKVYSNYFYSLIFFYCLDLRVFCIISKRIPSLAESISEKKFWYSSDRDRKNACGLLADGTFFWLGLAFLKVRIAQRILE